VTLNSEFTGSYKKVQILIDDIVPTLLVIIVMLSKLFFS